MAEMVQVVDLHKQYWLNGQPIEVLRGAAFAVSEREMVAILGPSGAGKSTLLHLLGTLDTPNSGRIHIAGQEVGRFNPDRLASFRNRTIGFVFQFHHLLPEFTALENTMMPALVQRRPRSQVRRLATEILERVGLAHRLQHRPVELSGGEQQRVALARALLLRPPLLLADEPTGNLDDGTAEGIHQLLFELNRQLGMTTVLVTHNRSLAARMNRMFVLQDGRVQESTRTGGAEPRQEGQEE